MNFYPAPGTLVAESSSDRVVGGTAVWSLRGKEGCDGHVWVFVDKVRFFIACTKG